MKTTVTRAHASMEAFVSRKELHMNATVPYTGVGSTVKVRFQPAIAPYCTHPPDPKHFFRLREYKHQ